MSVIYLLQCSVRKVESTRSWYSIMEAEAGHAGQGSTHQKWLWVTAVANWTRLYAEKGAAVTRVYCCVQHMRLSEEGRNKKEKKVRTRMRIRRGRERKRRKEKKNVGRNM